MDLIMDARGVDMSMDEAEYWKRVAEWLADKLGDVCYDKWGSDNEEGNWWFGSEWIDEAKRKVKEAHVQNKTR